MIVLNDENRVLFGEQINDHIAKLNEMMAHSTGQRFQEGVFRKTCFANRLLKGSTQMLGLEEWSLTLDMFGQLLDRVASSSGTWDENLSQIVSEILETEEKTIGAISSGVIEADEQADFYRGLQKEIELLMAESYVDMIPVEHSTEEGNGVTIEEDHIPKGQHLDVRVSPEGDIGFPEIRTDSFRTLNRLVGSLEKVNDRFRDYLLYPEGNDPGMRDLELAFGESEFYIGLLGNILRQLNRGDKVFRSKVSSSTVIDGVNDFIQINGRLRDWSTEVDSRVDSFSMERETASDLALTLESCIYDVCRMAEGDEGFHLKLTVEIINEGTYMTCRVYDNRQDCLSDSEMDQDDTVAFYKGLLTIRNHMKKWGCLLWVEPEGGQEERFRFTFPRSSMITDYRIADIPGMSFAVPCHSLDRVLEMKDSDIVTSGCCRYLNYSGVQIPVCRIDELAPEDMDAAEDGELILVIGVAEKRIGIIVEEADAKVEGIFEQLTEGNWLSLTEKSLHMGDEEFPVLDAGQVLERFRWLQEMNESPDESGSYMEEEGKIEEERVSRV